MTSLQPDHFRALLGKVQALDLEIRAVVPRCPRCGRPDGGVVPNGLTPQDAGIVDRARCPEGERCAMRARPGTEAMLLTQGTPVA